LAGLDIGRLVARGKIFEIEKMSLYPGSTEQWSGKSQGGASRQEARQAEAEHGATRPQPRYA
jgi:hypothetical protein